MLNVTRKINCFAQFAEHLTRSSRKINIRASIQDKWNWATKLEIFNDFDVISEFKLRDVTRFHDYVRELNFDATTPFLHLAWRLSPASA